MLKEIALVHQISNQERTTQRKVAQHVEMAVAVLEILRVEMVMAKFAVLLVVSCVEAVLPRDVAPVLTAHLAFTPAKMICVHNRSTCCA